MKENNKILAKNLRALITKMKKDGTVGASKACLKQLVSTKGLTCSVEEYNKIWEEVVNSVTVKGFDIYD